MAVGCDRLGSRMRVFVTARAAVDPPRCCTSHAVEIDISVQVKAIS